MPDNSQTTDGAEEVPMLNEKYALNNSKTTKSFLASFTFIALLFFGCLGIIGGSLYVSLHFIIKFW